MSEEVLLDDLMDEYLARCRAGETPRIEDYARAHPHLADEIRELFPAIVAMEDIKTERQARHERQSWAGPGVERLGDFRLVRELGRGGMGIVYEAEQESLGRRVAVKILPRPALLRGHARERFEREARTAAKLHHTNIVPVFGVGHYEDYHFLVMQYIAGIGLDEILRALRARQENPLPVDDQGGFDLVAIGQGLVQRRDREMPKVDHDATRTNYGSLDSFAPAATTSSQVPEVERPAPLLGKAYYRSIAQIGIQVADALAYAHSQGTLHRDIKPGNLLLDADGTVWVADFGLAKAIDQDSVTHSGDFVGTLRYMAPEQFDGQTDSRSDIYSIGLTLHELITLRPAFADSTRSLRTGQIGDRDVVPARRLNPHVPLDLDTIVQKAVSRDPNDRYPSADELALDLRLFLEERPIRARRITAVERLWRWSKRNRELAALLSTTFVLLLAIVGLTTYGYVQAKQAATRLAAANAKETTQRERAEQTVDLTLGVLDRIFDEFTPSHLQSDLGLTFESELDSDEALPAPSRPVLTPERAQLLNHMLAVFQQLAQQEGDDLAVREKAADAHRRVAMIQQNLGAYEEALGAYRRARELLVELAGEQPGNVDFAIAAVAMGTELGELEFRLDRPRAGKETLEQTLAALAELPEQVRNHPLSRYEKARAMYTLVRHTNPPRGGRPRRGPGGPGPGRLFGPERRGDGPPGLRGDGPPGDRNGIMLSPAEVDRLIDDAIRILEHLVVEQPQQPEYRHLLARCDTLPMRRRPGSSDDGERTERGVSLLEELVRDFPNVPEYQLDLAEAYAFVQRRGRAEPGELRRKSGRMQEAEKLVRELIAKRPGIPAYENTLVRILERQARLFDLRNPGEAASAWRDAINRQSSLVERFPDVGVYRAELSNLQRWYGEHLVRHKEYDTATDWFEASYATAQTARQREPDTDHLDRIATSQLQRLSDHLQRHGNEARAKEVREELETMRPLRPPGRGRD